MTTGCFRLSGDFDPDQITRSLKIEPTWIARIGDPGPRDRSTNRTTASWCLSAKEASSGDIADQLIELLVALRDSVELVAEFAARYNGIIELISFRDSPQDAWFLSAEVMGDLARLCVPVRCWNETIGQHEAQKEWLRANQLLN